MSGELGRAFLDDIVGNIDDDTPRLVYADWLMENGHDDRAEFIRVQIERARRPSWDPAQVRLKVREEELLRQHGEEWLSKLPRIPGARWEGFRRGIIAEVSFTSFEAMRKSAHLCRAVAPVEAVTVRWPRRRESKKTIPPIAELRELHLTGRADSEEEVARLADSPQLSTLRTLTAGGLWLEALNLLTASPHLSALKAFRLPSNNLGNAGIYALTRAAALTALEELTLHGRMYERYGEDPTVHTAGMEALAAWEGLATVRSLTLVGSDIRGPGLRALLRSRHGGALRELTLRGGRLDGQAMAEFSDTPPGLQLGALDLGENILKELGVAYLATAPCLRELKSLSLDRCEVPLSGARQLAKALFLAGLCKLEIAHNNLGPVGLEALLDRAPPSLHSLGLRDNDLFDNGAKLLAESPASDTLLELDLSQNGLGPAGVDALGAAPHLRNLLLLYLKENRISQSSGEALAASPLGQRLAVLDLKDPAQPGPSSGGSDDIPF